MSALTIYMRPYVRKRNKNEEGGGKEGKEVQKEGIVSLIWRTWLMSLI